MKTFIHNRLSVALASVVIAGLTTNAMAQPNEYRQAPQLAELVEAGELPPLEERLPDNPLVLEPVERTGVYGGEWRMGLLGGDDTALLVRTIGYENLVRWNPDWTEVVPNVAESFEVNQNATEYTFRLRQGMKWSDGEPFTADDIMFWYEDIFSNEQLTPAPSSWLVSGGEPVVVEKVDDYTVVFRFSAPNALFLQRLASPFGEEITLYPRHYLERFHADYNADGIDALIGEAGATDWATFWEAEVGNIFGLPRWQDLERPILFAWTLTEPLGNQRVTAERNPYYFKIDTEGNQLPYIDRVVYDQFEDEQVLVLRALSGEIDMQERHISALSNKATFFDAMETGGFGFFDTIPDVSNAVVISLNLNHKDPAKREIFQNKDFRIGLSHAINRQEIIDLIQVGQGEPFQAAPRPESPLYHERLAKQYTEYDLELANEHLDRAGFAERDAQGFRLTPDGKRISFVVESIGADIQGDVLELVQGYWQAVGVDMQFRIIDRSLFDTRKNANEHDAVVAVAGAGGGLDVILNPGWYFPFRDTSDYAMAWQSWYNDPTGSDFPTAPEEPPAEVKQQMELYNQITVTGDPDAQAELMMRILDIAADQFYVIGVSLPPSGYGIVKNNFHNVPTSFPNAYAYPTPAPTNPSQYFIDSSAQQ